MALFIAGDLEAQPDMIWHTKFNAQSWLIYSLQGALALMTDERNWDALGNVSRDTAAQMSFDIIKNLIPGVFMIGAIIPFAGTTANIPANGLYCDGSSVLRSDYPDLFATIGTNWGSVDGTHFNLPDLRGRAPIGAGSGSGLTPRSLASETGEETHQLTTAELASHSHSLQDFTLTGTAVPPPLDSGVPTIHIVNATGSTGGDAAHNNMQPSVAVNYYIIAQP